MKFGKYFAVLFLKHRKRYRGWSMPTYWKGANIIHFAASKKHIGLYPGDEAPVVFADQLAGYDVSKGTIRIPYISPLPKDLIANIARWCYEEYRK